MTDMTDPHTALSATVQQLRSEYDDVEVNAALDTVYHEETQTQPPTCALCGTGGLGAFLWNLFPFVLSVGTTTEPDQPERATSQDADGAPLSDEERVLHLLREYGTPMPQKRFSEETGWSKSKVSRLLSEMADAGAVTKITVGRENIITTDDDSTPRP